MHMREIAGLQLAELAADGSLLDGEAGALDIIGEIYGTGADMVVVPVSRLGDGFFDLKSGKLGAVTQKFTNYQLRAAFIGDISKYLASSKPLQDYVRETNAGKRMVFANDLVELEAILSR